MDRSDRAPILRSGAAYDVIVVGARPAGAATAMLLARHGLRTLLLDHRSPGLDTRSTHALLRGAVLQLARWGLLDELVATGTPPVRRTTFRYGDQRVTISIKPSHGVDALYAPRRSLLDLLLLRAALAAGVAVHHATSVVDVVVHGGRVVGVRAVDAGGGSVVVGAPLVVGADGIRSTIAERVGSTFTRVGKHATAMTYASWPGLVTDGCEWIFRPNACAGVVPTNDGDAYVFASASPERIGSGGVARIREIVDLAAPDLADRLQRPPRPGSARTWAGRPGYVRRSHGPGWALVGDAGYFTDPIATHGLTDALRDAELLARAVVAGFGDEASLDAALISYQHARDRLALPFFDVVDRIASQQWDDAAIAQLNLRLRSAMAHEVDALAALDERADFHDTELQTLQPKGPS